VDERAHDAQAVDQPRETAAGLAQLDAAALDLADREPAADERVEVDAARQHVAPRVGVAPPQAVERLLGDEGDGRPRLRAVGRVVVLALEAVPGAGADALDRLGQVALVRRDRERGDLAHQ